jgi:hypothetical protein
VLGIEREWPELFDVMLDLLDGHRSRADLKARRDRLGTMIARK